MPKERETAPIGGSWLYRWFGIGRPPSRPINVDARTLAPEEVQRLRKEIDAALGTWVANKPGTVTAADWLRDARQRNALLAAAHWFEEYADEHRRKAVASASRAENADRMQKAERNAERARYCRQAAR